MVRSHNPFTQRQLQFLDAIRKKLCDISSPDTEILTIEDYEWHCKETKDFGKIPKIKFAPRSTRIKAEIVTNAGLVCKEKEKALVAIRQKYGVNSDSYSRSRLFESEWNNLMVKALRAMKILAILNTMFATKGQSVSDPVKIVQKIVLEEHSRGKIQSKNPVFHQRKRKTAENGKFKQDRPYDQFLADLK